MTYQRALDATSHFLLRKLPKAKFFPFTNPITDLADLPLRDFNPNAAEVKTVVDVIAGVTEDIREELVMKCVVDGDFEALPDVFISVSKRWSPISW